MESQLKEVVVLYSGYDFLWFFAVYAFLGWCSEVAYAAMCQGKFINRGFLNGPYCPIYGFGVVIVIACLTPLKENGPLLFVGSVLLTSALEWVTGFILEKVFHDKWWDYSDTPFNLNGYICLKFSVLWGFACVFIVDVFHPTTVMLIRWIPKSIGWIAIALILIAFTADAAVTAVAILKLNKRLEHMEEIAEKLKVTSNRLGEEISEGVLGLMEKQEEMKDKTEELTEEWTTDIKERREELRVQYEELRKKQMFIYDRMINAYPRMSSLKYQKHLDEIRKELKERKKKRK